MTVQASCGYNNDAAEAEHAIPHYEAEHDWAAACLACFALLWCIGQWAGSDASDGLVKLGEVSLQHRL